MASAIFFQKFTEQYVYKQYVFILSYPYQERICLKLKLLKYFEGRGIAIQCENGFINMSLIWGHLHQFV